MQLDTKHVLDKKALPIDVYQHIIANKLPKYEWNIIDMATRTRFTAYSHELNATFGHQFIFLVMNWVRAYGINNHVHIQADNGPEFCMGSKSKELRLNNKLKSYNASFSSISPGKHYKQGVIENSHRHDDEEFLIIHSDRCKTDYQFIHRAQQWQDTWNAARPHYGIAMDGCTPLQKLKSKHVLNAKYLLGFPVILMEDLIRNGLFGGGSYVHTNYLLYFNENLSEKIRLFLIKKKT